MEEIQRLYKRFMKLDKDQSGTIDKEEFMVIPGLSNNPLVQRVIDIFDDDGGGDVDFKEFLMGLSAFSSKGQFDQKMKCTDPSVPSIRHFLNRSSLVQGL